MPQGVNIPKSLRPARVSAFTDFAQKMVNRLAIGQHRYGKAAKEFDPLDDYMARLKRCVREYEQTGNLEKLVDAANYCLCESQVPLHPNAHFASAESNGKNGGRQF